MEAIQALRRELRKERDTKKTAEQKEKILQKALDLLEKGAVNHKPKLGTGERLSCEREVTDEQKEAVLYALIEAPTEGMLRTDLEEKSSLNSGKMSHVLQVLLDEEKILQTNAPLARHTRWKLREV